MNPLGDFSAVVQAIADRTGIPIQRFAIGGPSDDLIGGSLISVARVIDTFLGQLKGEDAS
jgi:hypothetical protein